MNSMLFFMKTIRRSWEISHIYAGYINNFLKDTIY